MYQGNPNSEDEMSSGSDADYTPNFALTSDDENNIFFSTRNN